ncbi:DUF5677 domain-containing protein [Candidatus Halocynthiibacter alkanivorans]|uniref:DUF5677 domain-containing protein n=1 Tax=Candidatus Halocynthiibacter alkanivorans TaxID=2267619 RepID=UPI000DF45C7F|nr:DUF5677 domain-containing protein [Candidatus Halocynthiibacter alkanivorans]
MRQKLLKVSSFSKASILEAQREVDQIFYDIDAPENRDKALIRLFAFLKGRTAAAQVLVEYDMHWDAEILLRPFYEACAKILFICYQLPENKGKIANEFLFELSEIHSLQNKNKAEPARKLMETHDETNGEKAMAALQDDRIFTFSKLSRKERQSLLRRWSFSSIICFLDQEAAEFAPTKNIGALTHMYSAQSHLSHADICGLGLIEDEALRSNSDLQAKVASHICRILSDQSSLWLICMEALRWTRGETIFGTHSAWKHWKCMNSHTAPINEHFWKTQTEYYDKYSKT